MASKLQPPQVQLRHMGAYPKGMQEGPKAAWKATIDHLPIAFKVTIGDKTIHIAVANVLHQEWIDYCSSAGLQGSGIGLSIEGNVSDASKSQHISDAAARIAELAQRCDVVSAVEVSDRIFEQLKADDRLKSKNIFNTEEESKKPHAAVEYKAGEPKPHNESYAMVLNQPIETRKTIFGAMSADTDNPVQIGVTAEAVFVTLHAPGAENSQAPSIREIVPILQQQQSEHPKLPIFVLGDLNQEPEFVRPHMESACADTRALHRMRSSYLTSAVNGPWQGNPPYATGPRPAEFCQAWAFVPEGMEFAYEQVDVLSNAEQATVEACALEKEAQRTLQDQPLASGS